MLVCLAGMRSRLCVHPVVRCRCSLSSLFTVFWGCRPLMSMPDALFTAIIIVVAAVVLAAVVVRVSVPAVRPVVCRLRFVRGFAEENSVPVSVSIFVRRCVAFSIAYYRRRPSCSPLRFPSLDTPPLPPRLSSSYRPAEPRPSHRSPQPSPHLPPHPPSRASRWSLYLILPRILIATKQKKHLRPSGICSALGAMDTLLPLPCSPSLSTTTR